MAYSEEEVRAVWHKCDKRCTYGQRKTFRLRDYRKKWEIDHANADGVDDLRNWRVSCIKHNRQKLDKDRQEFERWLESNPSEKTCDW